ncbi:helix-turn-helix domain-containing protein [Actibacterium mucosum]|uniref:helix-turn-helix domain-containing protein n=1 Tax=Actibacterium mucosum TaxID=1087332 RepID=UPI0005518798|nr:helix-turn-helix domain-containing protein [Actibacterium mucosum]
MKLMDIGEVSAQAGMTPATLRYYEEIGLIRSAGRNGLRRQYGAEVPIQLALIALGKAAGFSLKEISGMFGPDGTPDLPRDELRQRAEALDKQIRELETLRDAMIHVADCPAPSHLECPTFQRLMRVAVGRSGR